MLPPLYLNITTRPPHSTSLLCCAQLTSNHTIQVFLSEYSNICNTHMNMISPRTHLDLSAVVNPARRCPSPDSPTDRTVRVDSRWRSVDISCQSCNTSSLPNRVRAIFVDFYFVVVIGQSDRSVDRSRKKRKSFGNQCRIIK